jgi:hypothetical protein
MTSGPNAFQSCMNAKSYDLENRNSRAKDRESSEPQLLCFQLERDGNQQEEEGYIRGIGRPWPTLVVFSHLGTLHEVGVHPMKSVNSFFLFDAESTARVTARSQILLHGFADPDILNLNLMAEFHRRFGRR